MNSLFSLIKLMLIINALQLLDTLQYGQGLWSYTRILPSL